MASGTTEFITGPARSGKSFIMTEQLLTDWLPNRSGVIYSNLPFNPAGIAAYFAARAVRQDVIDGYVARIKFIPAEVLAGWKTCAKSRGGKSDTPQEFFADPDRCGMPAIESETLFNADGSPRLVADLSRAIVILDECHNFCGKNTKAPIQEKWQEWLGELGHLGATFKMISQHPQKLSPALLQEAEVRYEIVKGELKKDAVLGIEMGDWWQLKAKLLGRYEAGSWYQQKIAIGGKWRVQSEKYYKRHAEIFSCYDSHNASVTTGQAGEEEERPHEKFGWPRLLAWFVGKNFDKIAGRGVPVLLVIIITITVMFFPHSVEAGLNYLKNAALRVGTDQPTEPATVESHSTAAKVLVSPGPASSVAGVHKTASTPPTTAANSQTPGPDVQTGTKSAPALPPFEEITGLTAISVRFRHGLEYQQGEVIDYGPYKGKRITKIEFVSGCVTLDDDSRLRFGMRQAVATAVDEPAKLPRSVPAAESGNVSDPANQRLARPVDDAGGGHAVERVSTASSAAKSRLSGR